MPDGIYLYVEGGGNKETKAKLRKGFERFFEDIVERAAGLGTVYRIIPCGSRDSTHKDFARAERANPEGTNLLLVDSDGPVTGEPLEHLRRAFGWSLTGVHGDRCHLMVQIMESWFLADIEALEGYYGRGFRAKAIPKNPDVEQNTGAETNNSLKQATRETKKGAYHKTRHAPELLKRVDLARVRKAAKHCNRLIETLEGLTS